MHYFSKNAAWLVIITSPDQKPRLNIRKAGVLIEGTLIVLYQSYNMLYLFHFPDP